MAFVPEHWGPHVWAAIHILAMGAPQEIPQDSKQYYAQFFNNLPHMLPCAACGHHLAENLLTMPVEPHLDGRESLFTWTVDLHNVVNEQTGKRKVPFNEAFEHWKRICLGDDKECSKVRNRSIKHWIYLGGSLMVIWAILYYFLYFKTRIGGNGGKKPS